MSPSSVSTSLAATARSQGPSTDESALGSVVSSVIQGSLSSYARAQTFQTGVNLTSTSPVHVFYDVEDDEYSTDHDDICDGVQTEWEDDGGDRVGRDGDGMLIDSGPTQWEHSPAPHALAVPSDSTWGDQPGSYPVPRRPKYSQLGGPSSLTISLGRPSLSAHERTPLIGRTLEDASFTSGPMILKRPDGRMASLDRGPPPSMARAMSPTSRSSAGLNPQRRRRPSSSSERPELQGGRSTFGQTLFNSIAILLGIGMLSCPLAFAYAGWIGGALLLTFYGFLTCYTANILAHIILSNPRLRTYADIGQAAFGPRANGATSALFCLELFAFSVILVVLFADSLHAVLPHLTADTYKLLSLIIIIPSCFLPLRILSFASLLGVLSTFILIFVLLEDGLTKLHAPGSLWDPAETSAWPAAPLATMPISFGLFMAGYSGHAVIPSIVRDMEDPQRYRSMINWAFFVATCVYGLIGAAGYCMFGNDVSAEVSQDMLKIVGYNPFLNKLALWMLVLSPITKFPLCTRPVDVTIQVFLGIEEPLGASVPDHNKAQHDHSDVTDEVGDDKGPNVTVYSGMVSDDSSSLPDHIFVSSAHTQCHRLTFNKARRNVVFRALARGLLPVAAVIVAIYVPDFSTAMAFLGAFSAFTLCVIGPLAAKMAVERRVGIMDACLMAVAVAMAVWATYISVTAA